MSERRNNKINERRTLVLVQKAEGILAEVTVLRDEMKAMLAKVSPEKPAEEAPKAE